MGERAKPYPTHRVKRKATQILDQVVTTALHHQITIFLLDTQTFQQFQSLT